MALVSAVFFADRRHFLSRRPGDWMKAVWFRYCQPRGGRLVICLKLWYIFTMRIDYTLLIFKEGTTLVSFCPELSVSSCGDTVEEARKRGNEAVRLFLEESNRTGTLTDVLEEEGFAKP